MKGTAQMTRIVLLLGLLAVSGCSTAAGVVSDVTSGTAAVVGMVAG